MGTFTKPYDPLTRADKAARVAREGGGPADDLSCVWPECAVCGEPFHPRRGALGYTTCLEHGQPRKTFAVVPVPKSNYVVATSIAQVASPYSHKGNR